jgi:hypothetical protein
MCSEMMTYVDSLATLNYIFRAKVPDINSHHHFTKSCYVFWGYLFLISFSVYDNNLKIKVLRQESNPQRTSSS